ncbi:MAG: energy-converting hydrogenase Eha subunit A [Cyclobacteriaceae bacterium]|jgi:energy-converting hydrogenase Eha subunit A
MLEVILVIYLSKKIGKILDEKGHNKGWYVAIFVITWIVSEISGIVLGAIIFPDAPVAMYIMGLLGAAAAYYANYLFAKSLPDLNKEDQLNEFWVTP